MRYSRKKDNPAKNKVIKCRIWYIYTCIDCPNVERDPNGTLHCFNRRTGKLRRIHPVRGKIVPPKWCKLPEGPYDI